MRRHEFVRGIRHGIPICLGYFSVSVAFGMTAVLSGMPLWAAVMISLTNLTSAGQFAGANLMIAGGGMAELGITTLIINIRYFLMSLSVSQKVEQRMSMKQRLAVAFGITDEIFAVSVQQPGELSAPYMAGLILTPVLGWTGGTLAGGIATSVMPEALSSALGIALYGMFIAIIIPPAREKKSVLFTVILAIAASVAFTYLPGLKNLTGGWSIIIITIVVSAVAAWLFPIEAEAEKEAGGMSTGYILKSILVMAVITYLIRMLPMAIFRKKITDVRIQSFLYYVPYAVLAAMTFPAIFSSTGSKLSAAAGCLAAVGLAYFKKGLLTVAVGAAAVVFVVQMAGF